MVRTRVRELVVVPSHASALAKARDRGQQVLPFASLVMIRCDRGSQRSFVWRLLCIIEPSTTYVWAACLIVSARWAHRRTSLACRFVESTMGSLRPLECQPAWFMTGPKSSHSEVCLKMEARLAMGICVSGSDSGKGNRGLPAEFGHVVPEPIIGFLANPGTGNTNALPSPSLERPFSGRSSDCSGFNHIRFLHVCPGHSMLVIHADGRRRRHAVLMIHDVVRHFTC